MIQTVSTLREWFETYVRGFARPDGKLHPMLVLKYEHCHRVARDSRDLALELGWGDDAAGLAEILGLYHDVGRFSQYTEFRTFYDRISINHAERGADVFLQCPLIASLPEESRTAVHQGILHHSRRHLPADMGANALRFVQLVRDADKLDDFFVLNDAIRRNDPEELKDIIWKVSLNAPPSAGVIEDILEGRLTSYDSLRSLADFNLIQLSWVFDINYAPTFRRIAERHIIDRIEEVMVPHASLPPVFIKVRTFLQDQVAA